MHSVFASSAAVSFVLFQVYSEPQMGMAFSVQSDGRMTEMAQKGTAGFGSGRYPSAHHCIFPSPTSLETKYFPLPRKTR